MNARSAALVAGADRERWALAGDQLYVDLDLSYRNLPPGTRLRIGEEAVVEVTDEPHRGCGKFSARFGVDALKLVNSAVGRELNMRGINTRVVAGGVVRLGDPIVKAGLRPASRRLRRFAAAADTRRRTGASGCRPRRRRAPRRGSGRASCASRSGRAARREAVLPGPAVLAQRPHGAPAPPHAPLEQDRHARGLGEPVRDRGAAHGQRADHRPDRVDPDRGLRDARGAVRVAHPHARGERRRARRTRA